MHAPVQTRQEHPRTWNLSLRTVRSQKMGRLAGIVIGLGCGQDRPDAAWREVWAHDPRAQSRAPSSCHQQSALRGDVCKVKAVHGQIVVHSPSTYAGMGCCKSGATGYIGCVFLPCSINPATCTPAPPAALVSVFPHFHLYTASLHYTHDYTSCSSCVTALRSPLLPLLMWHPALTAGTLWARTRE